MREREPSPRPAHCPRDRAECNRRRAYAPFRCIARHLPARIATIAIPATRRSFLGLVAPARLRVATARSFGLPVGRTRLAFMRDTCCNELRISGIVNAELGQ